MGEGRATTSAAEEPGNALGDSAGAARGATTTGAAAVVAVRRPSVKPTPNDASAITETSTRATKALITFKEGLFSFISHHRSLSDDCHSPLAAIEPGLRTSKLGVAASVTIGRRNVDDDIRL